MDEPKRALICVDCQRDFTPGGSLPVEHGDEVATKITSYLQQHADDYTVIAATKDWHPTDWRERGFTHFSDTPDYMDTWPPHCIQDTEGATFHPNFELIGVDDIFYKGQEAAAYSGFEGKTNDGIYLNQFLEARQITDVDVCGLALDYCVKATALGANVLGFKTTVLLSLTAPVGVATGVLALKNMNAAGVLVEVQ